MWNNIALGLVGQKVVRTVSTTRRAGWGGEACLIVPSLYRAAASRHLWSWKMVSPRKLIGRCRVFGSESTYRESHDKRRKCSEMHRASVVGHWLWRRPQLHRCVPAHTHSTAICLDMWRLVRRALRSMKFDSVQEQDPHQRTRQCRHCSRAHSPKCRRM